MKKLIFGVMLAIAVGCGSPQAQAPASPIAAATPTTTATPTAPPTPSADPTAAPSPSQNPKPSPVPPPSTSPSPLFAALEAKGTANAWTYNTVAIAGLDGYARAKTTFTPMPVPSLGCIDAILPESAHVAAGKVFYADAKGVIRSLAIDGTVATVTAFPITSTQQMLSFAVSPDGSQILGTVLTLPKTTYPCDGSAPSGMFSFDTYTANSGQASHLVYHESGSKAPTVMALTGWDAVGPIGTYPSVWASQGGGPGSTMGPFVRIDPVTVKVTGTFGDPTSCRVWDSVQSGAFVCTKDPVSTSSDPYGPVAQPVSIRSAAGPEEWHFTVTSVNGANSPHLAPDGQHVVICCDFDTSSVWLLDKQGHQLFLGSGFYDSGWLDATTVIGNVTTTVNGSPGTLSYVAINAPGTYVSMGFVGRFLGAVRI
jgi:hypothetical protein